MRLAAGLSTYCPLSLLVTLVPWLLAEPPQTTRQPGFAITFYDDVLPYIPSGADAVHERFYQVLAA